MSNLQGNARKAGVLYLLILILAPLNHLYFSSRFIVPGNSAATAYNISANPVIYRLGIFSGLAFEVIFLLLAVSLYRMLHRVDRGQARLMVILVTATVGIGVVNLLNQAAPLMLTGGARFGSTLTQPQRDALAYVFLRLRNIGDTMTTMYWGLWLIPFGVLVVKSRWFPRALGVLLILGSFAYTAGNVMGIAFPAHGRAIGPWMLAVDVVAQLAMISWLLVRGAQERSRDPQPSYAG